MKKFRKVLIFLWDEIERIVFPQCCFICGKLVSEIWCEECKKKLQDKAIFKIERKEKGEYYFERHLYLFWYQNEIRKLLLDYKFNDKSYLYQIFSEIMIKNEKICGIFKKYDIMMPVPIHNKRKKQRGYNQSALIAKEIAKQIEELEYQEVVEKVKDTLPQSSLKKEQRRVNIQNVYKIKKKAKIEQKKVILLDDIYTTGSTVNAIAKVLKENGVKEILVLTIAKD